MWAQAAEKCRNNKYNVYVLSFSCIFIWKMAHFINQSRTQNCIFTLDMVQVQGFTIVHSYLDTKFARYSSAEPYCLSLVFKKKKVKFNISFFCCCCHCRHHRHHCHLQHDTFQSDVNIPTFWRSPLPPSSWYPQDRGRISFETMVNICQTTQHHITDYGNI